MTDKLNLYLNGALSYFEACSIFVLIAKNKILATNLLKKDIPSNREKLRYEIQKILSDNSHSIKIEAEFIAVKASPVLEVKELKKINQSNISTTFLPEIKTSPIHERVLEERRELYLKRGHLHGRLHESSTDEDRGVIAKQIIEIQPNIDELNRDLRQIESGDIPLKYLQTKATAEEYLEVRNAKMYIARYKKKLPEASPKEKIRLENLINKYQAKIENL